MIVDGGMADNPRPALYGAHHHLDVVGSRAVEGPEAATLCGRSCENDELGEVVVAADLRAATPTAGKVREISGKATSAVKNARPRRPGQQ